MTIDFNCPQCGRELRADDRHVGRKVRCPDCATLIAVPAPPANIQESIVELEPVDSRQPPAPEPPAPEPPKSAKKPRREPETTGSPSPPPAPPIIPPVQPQTEALPPPAAAPMTEAPYSPEEPLFPPPRKHPEDLIDMTAMVDIVFFLLIFFLVTSLQALEAVMDMPTPQASEGGVSTGRSLADMENDPNSVIVRIEDDDSIWVDDAQVFNDAELTFRLRTARTENDRRSLLVIGDADASHGAAVRVFDAGAAAGMSGISFIVQEKGEGTN
jgi:biopolymer transport protein ExbD